MAQKSWHWEAKQGLPLLTLTSSSHGRSIPGCFSTAQALHSHSSVRTIYRVGNGGLFHVCSLHSSGGSEVAEEGLSWRAQHPSSSVSWDFTAKRTDRSESKKQRLQIRRLLSSGTECTEKGNFCNSQDIFTNNLQFKYEFGAYMDGSWLIAEKSFYYGTCSTTWLPSWEFRRGTFGERMQNKEFFWHRIFTESNILSLQDYLPHFLQIWLAIQDSWLTVQDSPLFPSRAELGHVRKPSPFSYPERGTATFRVFFLPSVQEQEGPLPVKHKGITGLWAAI